jgi:outer membrane immunogenic protein
VDHSKLNSFQTLTGRLGYLAQPNLMIYAKGGVAWAQDHYWQTETIPAFSVVAQLSTTRTGYDVGGGFEWMFAPGWSSFVEYDYANFGSGSPADSEAKITQDLQMVLVGVNYRFGGR